MEQIGYRVFFLCILGIAGRQDNDIFNLFFHGRTVNRDRVYFLGLSWEVCPDGLNSWYWDSPINPSYRYETYVSKELINYIDSQYRTYNNRKGRAITGFSMGGHGALWLAFRHPDTYGACGSISGGVDIRPFPENWEMKQLLGPYSENPQRWNEYTVINQSPYNSKSGPLAIIIDCGYYDFFYTVNQKLHEKLRYYNIPHDFLTRPGGHTHEYWNNAIDYQLLFFYKYFHPN